MIDNMLIEIALIMLIVAIVLVIPAGIALAFKKYTICVFLTILALCLEIISIKIWMHCDDFMAVFPYNIYNMVIKWMKRGKKPSGDLLGPQNWPIVKKWISTYFWA